uniref:Uncharacterized protein n=1 Tax=Arundo donax TaxID=35708 RepID=A0A0A9B423_ARUDO
MNKSSTSRSNHASRSKSNAVTKQGNKNTSSFQENIYTCGSFWTLRTSPL